MSVLGYTKAGADAAFYGKAAADGKFAPVSTIWAPGVPVKAGQLLTHSGTSYTVNADMTTPGTFDTVGLTVVGGAAGAPAELPFYAPSGLLNRFDPATSLYNAKGSNLRTFRIGLGRAANGGRCEILTYSDSDGAGTTQAGQAPFTYDRMAAWPISLSREISRHGIPIGGTGIIRWVDNTATDARVTYSGTWTSGLAFIYSSSTGAALTCTFAATDFPSISSYTSVDVWYYDTTGADFDVSVNGASSGAGFRTVVTGNTSVYKKVTLTGLAIVAGSTVTVTKRTATLSIYSGVNAFTPGAGLISHNPSQGGSKAAATGASSWSDAAQLGLVYKDVAGAQPRTVTDASFTSGSPNITSATGAFTEQDVGRPLQRSPYPVPFAEHTYIVSVTSSTVAVMNNNALHTLTSQTVTIGRGPDLLILSIGANDKPVGNTPIATITAALTTIRNRFPTSDCLLCIEQQQADSLIPAANWEAFAGAMYTLADTLDLPLYDYRARIGSFTEGTAAGYYGDGLAHLVSGAAAARGRSMGNGLVA